MHGEAGSPNRDTPQPTPVGGGQLSLGSAYKKTHPPPGVRRSMFPTHTHLVFKVLLKHPGATGSPLGQEAGAGAHQAKQLALGLQAAWSSMDAGGTTGHSGREGMRHRQPCRQLSEAVLETADGLFLGQSQQERQGSLAPTHGRINLIFKHLRKLFGT